MNERRQTIWFFAIAFWVLAAGYGLRDPWPADEPRFVLVAKQMVESGDWLFPHRGQELYADKPPLFFWLLALCQQAIGSWRWSFLLPSLLSGMGTLWLAFDLGRRLWNPRAGLWAAIAILSALQFGYQFKHAQIDPTLVFFTTLSFYGICRHVLLGPHWRWFWIACFAAGLGVVLKGVGFLPLLALLPYAFMRRRAWHGLSPSNSGQRLRWSLGALAFFVAIALWFVPMLMAAVHGGDPEHRAYLDDLLFKQTATRYAESWHHRQPFWYFAEIIALFWLPFSLALPWLWRDWREAWRRRDARVWLPLSWGLLVLLFFSLSPGKRDMYILPALPAFALAAAPFADRLWSRPQFRMALWAFVLVLGLLLFAVGASALSGHLKFASAFADERGLGAEVRWLWWLLAGLGAFALVGAAWWRPARVGLAVSCSLLALWTGYGLVVQPLLDATSSSHALMQRARVLAGPGTEIGLIDWQEQNLLQAIGPVAEFGFRASRAVQLQRGEAWLRAAPGRQLLVQASSEPECLRLDDGHALRVGVANRRVWWLADAAAIVVPCR